MWNRLFCVVGIGVLAAVSGACERTTECTLIGCQDQFSAAVSRADGSFPSGTHRIEILADGASVTCTFAYPLMTGPSGATVSPSCPTGLVVSVEQQQVCTQTNENGGVASTCQPIPGQFFETIRLVGTPAQVHVWQYVDDVALLDAATAPAYQDYFPNGPACGPPCHQASAVWTLN